MASLSRLLPFLLPAACEKDTERECYVPSPSGGMQMVPCEDAPKFGARDAGVSDAHDATFASDTMGGVDVDADAGLTHPTDAAVGTDVSSADAAGDIGDGAYPICNSSIEIEADPDYPPRDEAHYERINNVDIYSSNEYPEYATSYIYNQLIACSDFVRTRYDFPDITERMTNPWKMQIYYTGEIWDRNWDGVEELGTAYQRNRAITLNELRGSYFFSSEYPPEWPNTCLEPVLTHEWVHQQLLNTPIDATFLDEGLAKYIEQQVEDEMLIQPQEADIDVDMRISDTVESLPDAENSPQRPDYISLLAAEDGAADLEVGQRNNVRNVYEILRYQLPLGTCFYSGVHMICAGEPKNDQFDAHIRLFRGVYTKTLMCNEDGAYLIRAVKDEDGNLLTPYNLDGPFERAARYTLERWTAPFVCSAGSRKEDRLFVANVRQGAYYLYACFWKELDDTIGHESFNRLLASFFEYQRTQISGTYVNLHDLIIEQTGIGRWEAERLFERYRIQPGLGTYCNLPREGEAPICWPFWQE